MSGADEQARIAKAPGCPRCGYDQAGAMAAWERAQPAQCPLEGTCTECGLRFLWRDLLAPEYARRTSFFEHATQKLVRAFLRTWWWSVRPWVLWRVVRMEYRISWRRILVFVPLAWAMGYLLTVLCSMCMATASTRLSLARGGYRIGVLGSFQWMERDGLLRVLWPVPRPYTYVNGEVTAPGISVALLAAAVVPATFVLLPVTLRRAKVRRAHLVRVWLYWWAGLPLLFGAPLLAEGIVELTEQAWRVIMRSRFWPPWSSWDMDQYRPAVVIGVIVAWVLVWWTFAAGRYLRLRTALAIGLAMTVLSVLVAAGLICAVPGGATWLMHNM